MNLFMIQHRIDSFFKKTEGQIVAGSLLGCSMVGLRMIVTGNPFYISMVWNLFLGLLPYALSTRLARKRLVPRFFYLVQLFAWLMLIPNAFYMITDLVHLNAHPDAPLWFDLALLIVFAYTGMLTGVYSVRHVELLVRRRFLQLNPLLIVMPLMLLNSLGVYLGRVLRFNSWDVLCSPFALAGEIVQLLVHPLRNRPEWYMIGCYTVVLVFVYYTLTRREPSA